jgi:hypothetical protein
MTGAFGPTFSTTSTAPDTESLMRPLLPLVDEDTQEA